MLFVLALLLSLAVGSLAGTSPKKIYQRHLNRRSKSRFVSRSAPIDTTGTDSSKPSSSSYSNNSTGTFKQDIIYKSEDFLNQWDFFASSDPTHGLVNYQAKSDAQSKNLISIDGNTVVLAVDDTTTLRQGQKRDSVRITSQKSWSSGLFIADFAQMPFGCSLWPAYWLTGPNWPSDGEVDVVEGVNDGATNQYTLHTSQGCTASKGTINVTGKPGVSTQCATIGGDNTGCAYQDTDARSYGQGFNDAGGGVFAHLMDHTGIKIWHFARGHIPANIQSGSPNPSSWGPPVAYWSSATCNIGQHFNDLSIVISTTLCGDWAGSAYGSSGCSGTCEEVVADPSNFKNAKWVINYIGVYQPA